MHDFQFVLKSYLIKMKGVSKAPPRPDKLEICLAAIGSCLAFIIIGLMHTPFFDKTGLPLLMAPLGASAVLVFGASRSPLAQPRNVVGGHVLSAVIGVTVYQLFGGAYPITSICVAVPSAIAIMHISGTLHPPGGATAFLTSYGGLGVHELGYWYVLSPCALGSIVLVLTALVFNNIHKDHQYPQFW